MDKIHQDIPPVNDLTLAERRFARRVILATALGLAASTALFINRPYILMPGSDALAHQDAGLGGGPGHVVAGPDTRRRLAAAPISQRSRLIRSAPPQDGTRHRLVAENGPPTDDTPFGARPPVDEDLFALNGGSPHMQPMGSSYRLSPARTYFVPQTHVALNERMPLVWLKAAPVPEPATWITLIAGLAMVGLMLRRSPRPNHDATAGDAPHQAKTSG
jgi:hypothetical protein